MSPIVTLVLGVIALIVVIVVTIKLFKKGRRK